MQLKRETWSWCIDVKEEQQQKDPEGPTDYRTANTGRAVDSSLPTRCQENRQGGRGFQKKTTDRTCATCTRQEALARTHRRQWGHGYITEENETTKTNRQPNQISRPNRYRDRDNYQRQRRPGHSRLHPRWHDQETRRNWYRSPFTRSHTLVAVRFTSLLKRMYGYLQAERSVPSDTRWRQSPLRTTPRALPSTEHSNWGSPQSWHHCPRSSRREQQTHRGSHEAIPRKQLHRPR